jgi:hypothetical protein
LKSNPTEKPGDGGTFSRDPPGEIFLPSAITSPSTRKIGNPAIERVMCEDGSPSSGGSLDWRKSEIPFPEIALRGHSYQQMIRKDYHFAGEDCRAARKCWAGGQAVSFPSVCACFCSNWPGTPSLADLRAEAHLGNESPNGRKVRPERKETPEEGQGGIQPK